MTTIDSTDTAQPAPLDAQNDQPQIPAVTDSTDSSASRETAIQEGKDKAKAIMAASGLEVTHDDSPNAVNGDSNTPRQSSPTQDKPVNGEASSRKRSRSGSRKPKVPRADDQGVIQIVGDFDKFRLMKMIEKDSDYALLLSDQLESSKKFMEGKRQERQYWDDMRRLKEEHPARVFGHGFHGFGNGDTDVKHRGGPQHMLLYPAHRVRLGKRRARRVHIPRTDMTDQADLKEELVPIRLDIEMDKIKLRDTFTWNLHDYLTNADIFAEGLVEDFSVPPEFAGNMVRQVSQKIKDQIVDYHPHVFIEDPSLVDGIPYFAYKNDEMRVLIRLNITIGSHTLIDQFEWEINNPMNNAEEFARMMARDMALSGEFTTAIAHQIREQSQMFTRSLYIIGHPFDGRPIDDADVRDNFLPSPLHSVFRPVQAAKDYTPYLYELSEGDLQREELSILRDQRRQKRSVGRRGGPALPDFKDRDRTIRSLVVSTVLPGAVATIERARLFKYSRQTRGTRRENRLGVDLDSEESESEESDLEAEVMPQPVISTSRGRIVRGAASHALGAMRANLGRSSTPESSTIPHYERQSVRRETSSRFDTREETPSEPASLIVKLRLPKDIYRQWFYSPAKLRLDKLYEQSKPKSSSHTPAIPPATLPRAQSISATTSTDGPPWTYSEDGRVTVSAPPKPGQAVSQSNHYTFLTSNSSRSHPHPHG